MLRLQTLSDPTRQKVYTKNIVLFSKIIRYTHFNKMSCLSIFASYVDQ